MISDPIQATSEEPLRAELYSLPRLEHLARDLAAAQSVSAAAPHERRLLRRLDENSVAIEDAYHALAQTARNRKAITPAAEWLLDNFHIIGQQLREIRQDLPLRYYRELPRLASGPLAGLPRVYEAALELVAHGDARVDEELLAHYVDAYQSVAPLSMGELWAVPSMLRVALVENLRRLARQTLARHRSRLEADSWADRLLAVAEAVDDDEMPTENLNAILAEMDARYAHLGPAFAVRLVQRLRDQGAAIAPAVRWLDRRIAAQGDDVDDLIRSEHQVQAANQVSVGNTITSMRLMSSTDWSDWFERTSLSERVLREDPAGAYAGMDFRSRDRYRHVVERVARVSAQPEEHIAQQAVELAGRALPGERARHVGYYLVGDGESELRAAAGGRYTRVERVQRALQRRAALLYLGSVALLTALVLAALAGYALRAGAGGVLAAVVVLAGLLPASQMAVSLANWALGMLAEPRTLAKMDFRPRRGGIPEDCRTMVVVPALIYSLDGAQDLLDRLEVRYLANQDPHLHFALLGDFADAPEEHRPEDAQLVTQVTRGIAALNERYGADRFLYFHRRRQWNAGEGLWIGWERKRGKLAEFNRLLRGATDTSYATQAGDLSILPQIRFVITLDADTQLPLGAAHRLVGTLAHPLNRPTYDPALGRVTDGYAVLQPRISITVQSALASWFARIFAGATGLDPYTTAVSDIYQDLFGEGIYVGKGIYDVDAFAAATSHFPENTLLSHDLVEGLYARTALVTDIELFDDFPSHYVAWVKRAHRWTRGDWQIAPWLWARGRSALPPVSRWKILDNLRRSLLAPATLVWLALAWLLFPGFAGYWTLFALLVWAFPVYTQLAGGIRPPGTQRYSEHLLAVGRDALLETAQVLLTITFVAHMAYSAAQAVMITLARVLVTRRGMLEWETSSFVDRHLSIDWQGVLARMLFAPVSALALLAALAWLRPQSLPSAWPLLAAWALSPWVAFFVSTRRPQYRTALSRGERRALRRIARMTWHYFETFAGPNTHWLPPDNYQEEPVERTAMRTSPTNMGLLLVSTLAAHDFGYLGVHDLLERTEQTLATLEGLERFRGHFYNWYDIEHLQPIAPLYISTVDSGNLAGHLLTLKQALLQLPGESLLARNHRAAGGAARDGARDGAPNGARNGAPNGTASAAREGLRDGLLLVQRLLVSPDTRGRADASSALAEARDAVGRAEGALQAEAADLLEWADRLALVGEQVARVAAALPLFVEGYGARHAQELRDWVEALRRDVASQRRDVDTLFPWARLLHERHPLPDAAWLAMEGNLRNIRTLGDVIAQCTAAGHALDTLLAGFTRAGAMNADDSTRAPLTRLREALAASCQAAGDLIVRGRELAGRAGELAECMDFTFLYDEQRHYFSIGYSVLERRLDSSYYDLLASEARLASFVAIAKGDVPAGHWFHLDRPLAAVGAERVLLSWGGTMFEYLMPPLVMRSEPDTLLDETQHAAIRRQIQYGAERGVPWGMSEAAFNVTDLQLNYQYKSFGVPGLGLKRGLADDLVVAPYATLLAAPFAPHAVLANLVRLRADGLEGRYGLYESCDYTPARVPEGDSHAVIRSYMSHHQGMSLLALDNCLNGNPLPARFHSEPSIQAADLLLQERIPRQAPLIEPRAEEVGGPRRTRSIPAPAVRRFTTPHTPAPRTHILSNGRYSLMVTNAGGSYSQYRDMAVTRWREDSTRDNWGHFVYVRPAGSERFWSAAYQPACRAADYDEVLFSVEKAEYSRVDAGVETRMAVAISTEDDAEVRLITLTNRNERPVEIELTSYAELVLNASSADRAHPAFSKLFVQTEYVPALGALLAWRRPRAEGESVVYALHVSAVENLAYEPDTVEYETDRARFLGRGRSSARPAAMADGARLSGTTGAVLDPIFSLRRRVLLELGHSVQIAFVTACADSREAALSLADKYNELGAAARVFALAWSHHRVELRHLNLEAEDAQVFQRLASRVLYPGAAQRAAPDVLAANTAGQAGLWAYGISGDLPIVLARVSTLDHVRFVHELLYAHEYWRLKGLHVDLVVLDEHGASYAQDLQEALERLVRTSPAGNMIDKPGGVFVRRADLMPPADRVLLLSAARVVLSAEAGPLAEQVGRTLEGGVPPRRLARKRPPLPPGAADAGVPHGERESDNGLGGFVDGGREYVIRLQGADNTPLPWSNILANENAGCLVTESGLGYTWAVNSRQNKLTPWSNDPVSDPQGEALYLRDEESGAVWTPTPLPIREREPYEIRHGAGYTRFTHSSHLIEQELNVCMAPEDPVKLLRLGLRNAGPGMRRLTITFYVEWALGVTREEGQMFVVTRHDEANSALYARNRYNTVFGERVAFVATDQAGARVTGDRDEFLGRNGSPAAPAALARVSLSGRTSAGLDPCGALQVFITLNPREEKTIVFMLGQAAGEAEAAALIRRYRERGAAQEALAQVTAFWDELLGRLQVSTPDAHLNVLVNRWLLYQVLSSRLWGRTGFYQAGGAYGFRDQLQDVMAAAYARPALTREQILRAAGHQFAEGDVLHWWHPPDGAGTRTRSSDDYLWLPYVTAYYLQVTGDTGVLDEVVPFVELPLLAPDQEEIYAKPSVSQQSATLYEHCLRALDYGRRFGSHGLPLMGTGDWNDGMNRVGNRGKGESVWVAWFLLACLRDFGEVCAARGDAGKAQEYRDEAARLARAVEEQAWDGAWYRRAYFDDGTPLGSQENDECRIDSIAQSWKLLAGDAPDGRARQAMAAVMEQLVDRRLRVIRLFAPPFDKGALDPGYIKGYVPGVRENGGQYTHAAVWAAWAQALLGQGDTLGELFAMLDPLNHARTRGEAEVYKVEPYVVAADVYTVAGHEGRGGWTWYTGSAAWLYRLCVEALLGFTLRGDTLTFSPCVPRAWREYTLRYRHGSSTYVVHALNPDSASSGVRRITLDGVDAHGSIHLIDDGREHAVEIQL